MKNSHNLNKLVLNAILEKYMALLKILHVHLILEGEKVKEI